MVCHGLHLCHSNTLTIQQFQATFFGKSSTLIAHLTGQISDSACSFVAQLRIDKITKIGRIDSKEYKIQPTGSSKAIKATDGGVKNTYKTNFDAKQTLFKIIWLKV